ncbi:hypothetical protein D1818_21580 [Aquimarina sp. BL5]|uniref:hypothetical protein n=1 Tax=Aquimarina sp. BL5 TaxID=1714860 RepID=UPI000E5334B9|nr:hypothetical protein [Aquimarina sp. BL5]AXT53289.1 hypothetical protein D1818_21580 [Aquimarina sp. BL5]RKM94158.1 hypothetical protein D7036_22035 [Aquimarina sp. BL5]
MKLYRSNLLAFFDLIKNDSYEKTLLLIIISLIFSSCNNDDEVIEITTIRVNHYKTTTNGFFFGGLGTVLLIQDGIKSDKITLHLLLTQSMVLIMNLDVYMI